MNKIKYLNEIAKNFDIEINGSRNWDMQIHSPMVYKSIIKNQSLGLGESYVNKLWDCNDISELFYKITKINLSDVSFHKNIKLLWFLMKYKLFNFQTVTRSKVVAEKHYNLGNDLYELMLDKEMNYSCGYWDKAKNLQEAQDHKLDLICKKLYLKPGMRVLDVGCGWGSFARFAAKHYQVEVVGVTISKEQLKWAEEHTDSSEIEFKLQDYRLYNVPKFDRIVSIGMFEHVGEKNYKTYFKKLNNLLKDDGLFLLHTIGTPQTCKDPDPWIEKYIFPNSKLPSFTQISETSEQYFCMEDCHNFGSDYDKTLVAWYENFKNGWDSIKSNGNYDEKFYRMWSYYLLSCAGAFRSRAIHLWQVVLSKNGVIGGYTAVR